MTTPITLTVTETFDGRTATARMGGERDYVRAFWVTSNVVVDQAYAGSAFGIPRLGEIYVSPRGGFDANATCREIQVSQRNESNMEWRVEAHYSTRLEASPTSSDGQTGGSPSQAGQENPLLRPATRRWGTTRYPEPAERTAGGGTILNSAGDPFDPPLTRDVRNLTLHVTKNLPAFHPLAIGLFSGAVNAEPWLWWDARQAKCSDLTADEKYENGTYYVAISAQFEFKKGTDTWDKRVLDRGFRQFATDPSGTQEATAADVVAGGSGYQVNDRITLAGGASTTAAVLRVTAVTPVPAPVGTIVSASVLEPGATAAPPGGPFAPVGTFTSGLGATFLLTWATGSTLASVTAAAVNTGGVGYEVGDTFALDVPGVLSPVWLRVTATDDTVDPAGPALEVEVLGSGLYSSIPSDPVAQASTSGTGTGATFDVIWQPGQVKQAIFIGGQRPTQPVLLDGQGVKLPDGGAPVFLIYDLDDEADFNLLGAIF